MTRQKKEILKKIEEIENFIAADEELGCGFAPAGFYTPLYEQIDALWDEIARLRHYEDSIEMMDAWRQRAGYKMDVELPF